MGVLAAAVILLAWTFLGRGPATDNRVALADAVAAPVNPAPPPAPAPAKDTKPEERRPAPPAPPTDVPRKVGPPAPVNQGPVQSGPKGSGPGRVNPPHTPPAAPPAPPEKEKPKGGAPPEPPPPPAPPPLLDPARRAQLLTNAPPPANPDLLAEGPEPVVVGYTRGGRDFEEKGTLCLLKTTGLWYREEATGKLVKFEARGGLAKWVETADKKYHWQLDEDKGLFTGKAKPVEGIDLRPLPLDRDDEGRYLLFSLEGLQERVEDALDQQDVRLMRACRRQAEALAAYCRENHFDAALVRLCEAVGPYLDGQTRLWEERRQAVLEAQRQMGELQRREAEARSRQQAHQLLGFAQALFGAIPQTVGYGHDRDTGELVEYQTVDDEAIASGLGEMMKANVRYAAEQAQIETAKAAFTQATAEKFLALQARYADNRKERARALRAVGARDFGLAPTDAQERQEQLAQACRDAKDYQALVQLLEDQVRQDRVGGQRDNPFLLVEICQLKALAPRTDARKKGEEVFALAKECAASARLVPAAAVYDFDRAHVLRQAARLALTASTLEVSGQSWAGAYNPKARYAVRLLDRMGPLANLDVDGEVREVRAWALLQGGDPDAALEQALEIQELRKQAPFFGFHLAQLYGARNRPGDTKEAMKWLEHAVKVAHFHDIAEMKKNPDLQAVRLHERRAFNDLTVFEFAAKQMGLHLSLTNKSAYPLTDVRIRVKVLLPGGKVTTLNPGDVFPRIDPQQDVVVKDVFKDVGAVLRYQVLVDCDQNRK